MGSLVGFTCAKLGEAEVLAEHGFDDILIANQVVGRRKVERLVRVAEKAELRIAVDHPDQAHAVSQAASEAGVTVGVLIEVDIGMGRCGVPPGEPALALAREIVTLSGLRFDGIQAYEGHLVYLTDVDERTARTRDAMRPAVETRALLEANGIPVAVVSGGSSATYKITGRIDGVDEIQAGSYATMDWRYAQMVPEFEVALSVLTRVISSRSAGAVLDVGLKGAGAEFGPPRIKDYPEVEIPAFTSEEHCIVRGAPGWRIGQTFHLLPSHCCTTCNLYRQIHVHEDGRVVEVWPIEGSGKLA
jgi:D-serine deaminase-like pyridoxal phosphate-dependent protein